MRKKSKSAAILAVVMAMTLAGSSAVYAEENSSAKTAETDDNEKEDTRAAENEPAPCNEGEHELIESKVVLPTCTESRKNGQRRIFYGKSGQNGLCSTGYRIHGIFGQYKEEVPEYVRIL